jgi:4-aminobutyrate aminotransferase-like enzyme
MHSSEVLQLLRKFESPNITAMEPDGSWPIVWERARGAHVWDADGRKYVDLTAAFGVAAAGHANRRVIAAGQRQLARLPHAMGDVHPHARKAELARELSRVTFERWSKSPEKPGVTGRSDANSSRGRTIFCNSGFEAVEAALKTAMLASGKRGVIAFTGAYHGLGYGALDATHRDFFRAPFAKQLGGFTYFVKFPEQASAQRAKSAQQTKLDSTERSIRRLFERHAIGAVLVEPVQGRGGMRVPPVSLLPLLRQLCDEHQALLVLDEIYTGFGRTGKWFACEHSNTVPDLICLGKAMAGGFPISACVGKAAVMEAAWPRSQGEALHTSTFLGHPVGCAMALAQIEEIRSRDLPARSAELGAFLLQQLASLKAPSSVRPKARGLGLMAGLELCLPDGSPASREAMDIVKSMLGAGFILLPEGEHGNVLGFTPPLTIERRLLAQAIEQLGRCLE